MNALRLEREHGLRDVVQERKQTLWAVEAVVEARGVRHEQRVQALQVARRVDAQRQRGWRVRHARGRAVLLCAAAALRVRLRPPAAVHHKHHVTTHVRPQT